jgi:hypothetical protein
MTHPAAIQGATRAAAKADRVHGDWSDRAFSYLERWASRRAGQVFMTEDVRLAGEGSGSFVAPPDRRAWGAVILRAKRAGKLIHAGYAANKDPSCHGSPKSQWRWVA